MSNEVCNDQCLTATCNEMVDGMTYEEPQECITRCMECGHVIDYGRAGKKFCNEFCKNRYHNRRSKASKRFRVKVLKNLERNYLILNRLVKSGVAGLPLVELEQMGFKLNYVTSYSKVRRHDEYTCYDIKFTIISSEVSGISRISVSGDNE